MPPSSGQGDKFTTQYTVEGVDEALRQLRELSSEEQRHARAIDQTGDEAAQASRQLDQLNREKREGERAGGGLLGMFERLRGSITGLVGGLIGVGGLLQALQAIRQEMQENTRVAREFQDASLNLQFLTQTFSKEQQAFVGQAAVLSGRGPAETARAFGDLRSRFPNLSEQDASALFLQVAETARTTDAPLSSLVNAFATVSQYETDPEKAQNILRQSIIEAGVSDPAKISPLLAQFLGVGTSIGGLSAGQAAGAVAGVTGIGLAPETAVTGLRNVLLGLSGQGTPGGREILERAGVDLSGNFVQDLQGLSTALQSGAIQQTELETIFGREGLPVAAALADPRRLQGFLASVGRVGEAQSTTRDLTSDAIRAQFAGNPAAARNFALKQVEAAIALEQIDDTDSTEAELVARLIELRQRQQGQGVIRRGVSGVEAFVASALGVGAEGAAAAALQYDAEGQQIVQQQIGVIRGGGILSDPRSGAPTIINNYGSINGDPQTIGGIGERARENRY